MTDNAANAGYLPIENYGIIGNLNTVALVGNNASIDFLCLPSFDSPTVFAALLDAEKGGNFTIAPFLENSRCKQMYLPETNILTTRFQSEKGVAEIVDYMPIETSDAHHRLIRTARAVKGSIVFQLRCAPRFDYGRATHTAEQKNACVVEFAVPQKELPQIRLVGSHPLKIDGMDVVAEFTLQSGEEASFILECGVCEELPESADKNEWRSGFPRRRGFGRGGRESRFTKDVGERW